MRPVGAGQLRPSTAWLTESPLAFMLECNKLENFTEDGRLHIIGSNMDELNFRIEHIGLAATKPVDLRNWYVKVMGATEIWTDAEIPPAFLIRLPGGEILEIYPSTSTLPETCHNKLAGWRHLALGVESIDATKKILEARGVVFDQPIKPAGGKGRVIFFQDLEGNLLHLVERPTDWRITDGSFLQETVA